MAKKLIGKPDNKAEKTARFWYVWRTFWYIISVATFAVSIACLWIVGSFLLIAATHYSASVLCAQLDNPLDCLNLTFDINRIFYIGTIFLVIGFIAWAFGKIKGKQYYV